MAKKTDYTTLMMIGVAAGAIAIGLKKKPIKTVIVPTSPIKLQCDPPSIVILDEVKTNQLLVDVAKVYIETLKKIEDLSYITLVGDVIRRINNSCYEMYAKQKFATKDMVLILAYLSISIQNAFKIAYFGDIINLKDDEITPEIKDDFESWKNFRDNINPEKIAELQKYLGYTSEMDNELENVKQIILVNDKYPA